MIGSIFKVLLAFLSAENAMNLVFGLLENLISKNPKLKEGMVKLYMSWEARTPDAAKYRTQYQDADAGLDEMERERQAKANEQPSGV